MTTLEVLSPGLKTCSRKGGGGEQEEWFLHKSSSGSLHTCSHEYIYVLTQNKNCFEYFCKQSIRNQCDPLETENQPPSSVNI